MGSQLENSTTRALTDYLAASTDKHNTLPKGDTSEGVYPPTPPTPPQKLEKNAQKYWKNWKISGPNGLSKCPESREMDFGHFWEKYFSAIFGRFCGPTFFEKMDLKWLLKSNNLNSKYPRLIL